MTDVKINLSQPILNNLLQQSGAIALILSSADRVLGTAGNLKDAEIQALVSALHHYWPVSITGNYARYLGLKLDEDYQFLSARFLDEREHRLGLVFPLETPLCQIRQDLTNLVKKLHVQVQAEQRAPVGLEQSLQFILKDYPAPDPETLSTQVTPDVQTNSEETSGKTNGAVLPEDQSDQENTQPTSVVQDRRSLTFGKPEAGVEPGQDETIEAEADLASETDLAMEDIPWQPLEDLMPTEQDGLEPQITDAALKEDPPLFAASKSAWQPLEDHDQQEDDLVSILQEDFTSVQDLTPADEIGLPLEDLPDPAETVSPVHDDEGEKQITDADEADEWEAVIPSITFYLVPRLKRHFLVKEMPHELRRWIPEICEIYGWQLDALSVRPDYLKWSLRDFPESLIRKMLKIVRRETSQRIFESFPNLRHGNPSEDFWSQSYLVDRENLEISTQALIAYVAKERLSGRNDT